MARMHEILGVKPYEVFQVKGHDGEFMLDSSGAVRYGKCMDLSAFSEFLAYLVNHPEHIIRKPRYTPEEVKVLKALWALDFRWVVTDEDGNESAYENKPEKYSNCWFPDCAPISILHKKIGLTQWSDTEPLFIAKALRDAGEEVEDV